MESFFEVLGIDPTKDEKRIKKAYRALLHGVNPEDDAEGFKQLREAYEQACNYARKKEEDKGAGKEDLEKTEIDHYIEKCELLYSSFFRRIQSKEWESLFEEAGFFDLEQEEELRLRFLTFLMGHFHLPFPVWQAADRIFRITGCREELIEHFPEAYVDFLQQAVLYEGSLNYTLFKGEPGAAFDRYIEVYQNLRQFTDMAMQEQAREALNEIRKIPVYHPYTELEEARLLLQEERKAEAEEILGRLAKGYSTEERIICCYAQYLGLENRWDEIGDLYDKVLGEYPDSVSAKAGKAEVLLHQGQYRDSREQILDLLEANPQDERLMQALTDANVYMIKELEPLYQSGETDQDNLMDLAWCYYQNMRFDDGILLMDSFEPDQEHTLDYHNLKGRILLTQEKDKEALMHLIPWLEEIKKVQPDGSKKTERKMARLGYAYYTIGAAKAGIVLSEKTGDLSEAMEYFEKAVEKEKDPMQAVSYQHTMADIWRQKKEYSEVLKVCESILKESPQYFPAVLLRQEAFLNLGMYQECADDFRRAVNLYPYHGKPYAILMKMYFLFGDYENAREILKQAESLQVDSEDLSIMKARLIAVTAQSVEDLEKALKILDEKRKKGWNIQSDLDQEEWQEINFRRGLILTDLSRHDEAREAFEEAMTKREDSGLLYSYGSLLMQCKDFEGAINLFERVCKEIPEDSTVLYKLGWCYKEKGAYEKSIEIMKKVLDLNPEHSAVRMVLTELYERLARKKEDNCYYEMALPLMQEQISRHKDAYHYIELGLLYLDMDRYEEALSQFNESIRLEPGSIYAYNNAGSCYLSLDQPEAAIPYFRKAAELMTEEKSPLPYNNLAKCYRMLNQPESAIACYQKNLELFPEEEDIWLQMTDCFREQEMYLEALAACRNGISKVTYGNALECALLRLLSEMDDRSAFEKYGKELLLKYPDNPVILQLIGETWLYGFEEYDYAIYYINKALEKLHTGCIPETPAEFLECRRGCLYLYGRALLARGDSIQAAELLRQYLSECEDEKGSTEKYESFYGESRRRRFRLGLALWFLKEYAKAEEYFLKVWNYPCRCDGCCKPCCFEGRIAEALILYGKGSGEEAAALYGKAIEAAPNDLEHRFELRKLNITG